MAEKFVDGLTLEERLEGLEFGLHNCRLEGLVLPKKDEERLRSWIIEGLPEKEICARTLEHYKAFAGTKSDAE
jgi:hypothetical protein